MIRWTKDGQVSRYGWHPGKSWEVHSEGVSDYPLMCHELADALDVAVAALKWYADPVAYSMPVRDMNHHVFPDMGTTAKKVLRQIGVEQ